MALHVMNPEGNEAVSVIGEIIYNTVEHIYEWKIINFFSLMERVSFSSPEFSLANTSWFFQIIRKSTQQVDYMAMKIAALEKRGFTIKYKFGLKRLDGTIEQLDWGIFKGEKLWTDASYVNMAQVQERLFQHSGAIIFTCTFQQVSTPKPERIRPTLDKSALKNFIRLNKLSTDFQSLLFLKDSCDATLRVRYKEYRAHRTILIARSPVFADMFLSETIEKQTGIVDIPDCDPESFQQFLGFLYTGRLEEPSPSSALHLYNTSHKYGIQELNAFCLEYLTQNVTLDNFCDVFVTADKHGDPELLKAIQSFFDANMSKILTTTQWDFLLKNNHRLANKLLIEMSSRRNVVE